MWAFINGTLQKACSSSYFQKLMYSGHKHCHGINFQSIVAPDGFLAVIYGLVNGNWHDLFLLSTSGPLDKLQALCQIYHKQFSSPCMVNQQPLNQSISLEDTGTLYMVLPMHFQILPYQTFVRWWNGDLLTLYLSSLS